MRDIYFIRWGKITPQRQLGYGRDTYHAPPAKNGLYAFPEGFVEPFLLGGFEFRDDRHEWVKKEDGSLISYEDDEKKKYEIPDPYFKGEYDVGNKYVWAKKTKEDPYHQFINSHCGEIYLAKYKPPKKFRHYGNIWTHWKPRKAKDVIDVYESWYLVDYNTYVKSLQIDWARRQRSKIKGGIPFSKDDCEVFIEKIITKKIDKK